MSEATATRRDTLSGILSVAGVAVVWGTIPLVLRAADGAPVIKVFFRVLFGAAVLLAYLTVTRRMSEVTSLPRRRLLQLAGQGILLTVNWLCFFSALELTSVATTELLGYTGPVLVAAFAPLVTREPFDRRVILPLALALGGIAVILAPSGLRLSSPRELLGAALAFTSAITYALLLLRAKRILRGVSGAALMTVEYATASLLLFPFAAWLHVGGHGPSSAGSYAALVTLGVVHTAGTGLVFMWALRRLRTDHAAVMTYLEPVSAVLLAAAFLSEPLTAWTVTGGLMVVAGGALIARLVPSFGPESADAGEVSEAAMRDGSEAPRPRVSSRPHDA